MEPIIEVRANVNPQNDGTSSSPHSSFALFAPFAVNNPGQQQKARPTVKQASQHRHQRPRPPYSRKRRWPSQILQTKISLLILSILVASKRRAESSLADKFEIMFS
jgi:hypothetical protein